MSNKRRTTVFYVGEGMFEHSKSFEEAAKHVGLSADEANELKSQADKHHMSINEHMKTVTFYNKPESYGKFLRWWLSKELAEQIIYVFLLFALFAYAFIASNSKNSQYHRHTIEIKHEDKDADVH